VLLVGLTGGIGSGKSTVAQMLASRGAVILDADAYAREALSPGSPETGMVIERFGDAALDASGNIDRRALAELVFNDRIARHDLEEIVHPFVLRRTAEGIQANAGSDRIVVLESPLLIEMKTDVVCDLVIVVAAGPGTQLRRLIERGMDEADAKARMAAQISNEERAKAADFVIDNDGWVDALGGQVDRLWAILIARAAAKG
jgi:dephospho-CoA kinase